MSYLLNNSVFNNTSYIVKHGGTIISVTIYDDDTIKEILMKLAIASKQSITSEHVFAWIKEGNTIVPLAFYYPDIAMDTPYKNKKIDDNFIDSDDNRNIVKLESSIHKIIKDFNNKTIFFITLIDYYKFLKLSYKNKISEDECNEKLGYTRDQWFYGKIKKYWPRLKSPIDFFEFNSPPLLAERNKHIKLESKLFSHLSKQLEDAYSEKNPLYPKEYSSYNLVLHNQVDDNIVYLFRLFNDISLGKWSDTILSFTKITLENYTDTTSKIWKDSIYYTTEDEDRHISKEVFVKWFRSPVISVPNTLPVFMDIRNSVTIKLHKDKITVTLIIYSSGHVKLLLNDLSRGRLLIDTIIEKIRLANKFISYLNEFKIYSKEKLIHIKDIESSFDICSLNMIYPVKNYKVDKMITLLNNLSAFVRFNKQNQTTISCIYKRVSDYESVESKLRVISLLHNSKRKLNKTQIIEELTKIFNISEEDATDEYEQWVSLSDGGKIFKSGENGVEFIIDLIGTNIKVDVSSIHSYDGLIRFYNFMNYLMKVYNDYIEHKKDPYNLFSKISQPIELDLLDDSEIDQILDQSSSEKLDSDKLVKIDELEDRPKQDTPKQDISTPDESDTNGDVEVSEESLNMDKFSKDSESSDSGIGLLEDSESEGGGYNNQRGGYNIQKGGYNVHRYYLNRLNDFDKKSSHYIHDKGGINLFSGYSVRQRKSGKNKSGTQGYTYATKCTPNNQRQPIAVSTEDLERYEKEGVGIGIGYREAFNIPERNPDTWYICPKYWNVKDDSPMDPANYESFKDDIVDNKSNTANKKDTDKFVLARNHSYWNKMGDNVNNYRLELLENFHPEGYKVPCCFARKDEIKVGWDVEVKIKDKSKIRWAQGKVKSIKKISLNNLEYTITLTGEEVDEVKVTNSLDIRRQRNSKYVSNSFPSNLGIYGYIHPILKDYLYIKDLPKDVDIPEINLYRKGIKRGTNKCDKTYIESIQELLHENNSSVKDLIGNIVHDLNNLKNTHNYISAIGGGSFINLFKKDIKDITDADSRSFRKYLKRYNNRFTGSHIQRHINKIDGRDKLLKLLSMYETTNEGIFINREFTEITAIYQFINYILSDTEIILDKYVSPVLMAIAKFPSKTFDKVYPNLSIVSFEGTSEDIFLESILGNYDFNTSSIMLVYKERGHLYEPVFYVKGGQQVSILELDTTPKSSKLAEYERLWKNNVVTQCKVKINELYSEIKSDLLNINILTSALEKLKLPIYSHIYDNYNKVTLIETIDNVYIPVKPFNIDISHKNKFIGEITYSRRPRYNKCIKVLSDIDKLKMGKPYLRNAKLTVSGITDRRKQIQLRINELVFPDGCYIPLKSEIYTSKHTLDIIGNISYFDIDKTIGLYGLSQDKRSKYTLGVNFKERLRSLFFQKSYILIKEKDTLYNKVIKIKENDIMLNYHKREILFNLLYKPISVIIKFVNKYYDADINIDKGTKLIICDIDDLSSKDVFEKLLKLFIDLLLNYSERDYERFLQIDLDLTKIKNNVKEGEYLIKQSDIDNESYLEYFIRYSDYIRNVGIYNEGLSRSKQIQLTNMKNKQTITLKKVDQYPDILQVLFGRGIIIKDSELSDIDIVSSILESIISEQQEMNSRLIESLLDVQDIDTYRINKEDLLVISKEYNIGFCLVTKQFAKKLYHDIHIAIDEDSFSGDIQESRIILLYQDDKHLYHIIKKDKVFLKVNEITSRLFKKELDKIF